MDNTTNGQDPKVPDTTQPSQPIQPSGPVQSYQANTTFPPQPGFDPSSQQSIPVSPANAYQQVMPSVQPQPAQSTFPPQPAQSPSVPSPSAATVPQSEPKKITLDDLYGPSGFANDSGPLSPLSQTKVEEPPKIPVLEPVSPVMSSSVTSVNPATAPIEPAIYSQPETAVPKTQVAEKTEVSQVTPSVPDLPKVGEPQPAQNIEFSSQNVPEVTHPVDLPLRKSAFTSYEENPKAPTVPPSKPPAPEKKEKIHGPNKFFIFRILFGLFAFVVIVLLIIFGVRAFFSFVQPGSTGKVTLTYWGLWEDSNTMQSVISQFERDNPNITIQYEKQDPKQYSERLLARIPQGNGPDIFTYHSSWLPMVQDILVPLPTSVISKSDLENNFYPVVRNDLVKNGALYGVPLGIDTLSLFVNNKMFKDAKADVPTSWDMFISTARALTVKDENGKIKVAGAAMGTFDNITHAPDIISSLLMQNGVDITQMTPSSNASDALSFYTSFATGTSNVWDSTLDPSQLAFARGNLAMYFGYSWDIFLIKASNPDLDFSVHPIPHLPGRNTTAASYWVQGVSSKSTHQKESLLFMQFLAQKNTEAILYSEEAKTRLFGEPYPRSDLGTTLKDNPMVAPFVNQAIDAKSSFFAGETYDNGLNGQMNGYLGNAVRAVLGNTSADSAIDTLTKGVLQIEKQYGSG